MSNDVYAVIRTGGKQYRVEPGQRLKVERLPGEPGDRIAFDDVLFLRGGDGAVAVGAPTVGGASVTAEILEQSRARKINVFKYKSKIRYRKLRGHRQHQTNLRIEDVRLGDDVWSAPVRKAAAAAQIEEAPADEPDEEPASVEAEASEE